MSDLKYSEENKEFESGAQRGDKKCGDFSLIPWDVIWDYAELLQNGAEHYGKYNWQKGIPSSSFFDSAMRHLVKAYLGWEDEPHLVQALFNVIGLIYNTKHHPELCDIPPEPYKENREKDFDDFLNQFVADRKEDKTDEKESNDMDFEVNKETGSITGHSCLPTLLSEELESVDDFTRGYNYAIRKMYNSWYGKTES